MKRLSVILPAHNSGRRLAHAVEQLGGYSGDLELEAIIVENGSSDDTWQVAQELTLGGFGFPVLATQSDKGLGNAYQQGIREASGDVVLLTADDLPFGLTDIESWERVGKPNALVVGSKAHPDSVVPRSFARNVMSFGYRTLRRLLLGMTVADCQGTLFIPADWAKANVDKLSESGYLSSTEIVYLAQVQRFPTLEVPVTLDAGHGSGKTRITPKDVASMALGLLGLRRRRSQLSRRPS